MSKITTICTYILLSVGAFLCVYPLFFMMISATNASGDILNYPPPVWIGEYMSINYQNLIQRIPIVTAFFNSLKLAIFFTAVNVFISSIAGYGFAKFEFKYKNFLFGLVLVTMMLPAYARLIPLYQMMNMFKIHDTHLAVILPDLAGAFGIFLMRQNFYAIPDSLIESARIDGAGEWKIFFTIVMPLMIPSASALGIYMFMQQWSNFTWPLIILNSPQNFTLPVALSKLIGDTKIDYGQIMMGANYAVLPILFVFFMLQKYFISGITSGAVKE
ncbi:MAG: carbohydrate ABC transporter permease [Brevinema sp.]